jgi:hypothetical protein
MGTSCTTPCRLEMFVLLVLLTMLLILALAGLVVAYVVFPRRGIAVPRVPWAGALLDRAVGTLPTLSNTVDGPHGHAPSAGRRQPS